MVSIALLKGSASLGVGNKKDAIARTRKTIMQKTSGKMQIKVHKCSRYAPPCILNVVDVELAMLGGVKVDERGPDSNVLE